LAVVSPRFLVSTNGIDLPYQTSLRAESACRGQVPAHFSGLGNVVDPSGHFRFASILRISNATNKLAAERELRGHQWSKVLNSRGKVLNSRGKVLNWRGKALNWRGKVLNSRGKVLNWRGKALNWRGKVLNWRGKVLNWRGKVLNWRGKVLNSRGKALNWRGKALNWWGKALNLRQGAQLEARRSTGARIHRAVVLLRRESGGSMRSSREAPVQWVAGKPRASYE